MLFKEDWSQMLNVENIYFLSCGWKIVQDNTERALKWTFKAPWVSASLKKRREWIVCRYRVITVSCCGCIAVACLPKSQFLITFNSLGPPYTSFSHPEDENPRALSSCLHLFWSRGDWMKMAELDLSKVPTILLLLQAWRAFSLYKREPIKQSASLHSSAPGSFHRHTPSSTYMYAPWWWSTWWWWPW